MREQRDSLGLDEYFWNYLLRLIKRGECIPFLGAGVCASVLPTANELAKKWAEDYRYPMNDCLSLDRVAQFIETKWGRVELYGLLEEEIRKVEPLYVPHKTLASLPFSMYVTTNYDDFMGSILERHGKHPVRVTLPRASPFKSHEDAPALHKVFGLLDHFVHSGEKLAASFKPTAESPIVFHPHGHIDKPNSIVITETDYYQSLERFGVAAIDYPPQVLYQLAASSFLFIGYSLADWNFRLLFHTLHNRLGRINSAVIFLPEGTDEQLRYAVQYFNQFTSAQVYLGAADAFVAELSLHWAENSRDA